MYTYIIKGTFITYPVLISCIYINDRHCQLVCLQYGVCVGRLRELRTVGVTHYVDLHSFSHTDIRHLAVIHSYLKLKYKKKETLNYTVYS